MNSQKNCQFWFFIGILNQSGDRMIRYELFETKFKVKKKHMFRHVSDTGIFSSLLFARGKCQLNGIGTDVFFSI